MKLVFFLLVVVNAALAAPSEEQGDVFVWVNFTLSCLLHDKPFDYQVELYELDDISENDLIARKTGTAEKIVIDTISGYYSIGGEWEGWNIETFLEVRSNCKGKKEWNKKHLLTLAPDCPIKQKKCYYLNKVFHLEE